MSKSVNNTNAIRWYMESLALHIGGDAVHWTNKKSYIYVVEDKIVAPRIKHIDIPVFFLNNNFKMVYLFQNMKILVSCHQICVPNHFRVQLSVGVLTGLLASTSTHPVILNIMNSWIYSTLKWLTFHSNIKCSFFDFFRVINILQLRKPHNT